MKQAGIALKEIIEKCLALNIYEKRSVDEEYCELVFYNKELDKWEKIFTDALGSAVKPPETRPTREDMRLTNDYGGIEANQTLFKKDFDGATMIAMFWPWGDCEHTTLKIALLRK